MKKMFLILLCSVISLGVFANTAGDLKHVTDKNANSNATILKKNSTIQPALVMTCFSATCITVCRSGGPSSYEATVRYLNKLDNYCKSR